MFITKIITVGIDIQNAIGIYSDLDNNIRNIIIDRFEGRCYQACFIKTINKIIKISDCYINQEGSPSFGTINVIFECTAIIYTMGEVINGCHVINKDRRIIMCNAENACIMLNVNESLESIQNGQIISVRVGGARYNIGSTKISVNAIPFVLTSVPIVYKITDTPMLSSQSMHEYLAEMLGRVKIEEERCAAIKSENPKGWEFFSKLLYAYKDEQKLGQNVRDLLALASKFPSEIKYLSRDPRLNLLEPKVIAYENDFPPPDSKVKAGVPLQDIMLVLLDDYYNYLRIVREMIEIYSQQNVFESHRNLWLMFKKFKV